MGSHIDETVVVAKKLDEGTELNQIEKNLEAIKEIKAQIEFFKSASDEARP